MSCVMKKQLFDEKKKECNRNKCDRWDVFILLEAETFCFLQPFEEDGEAEGDRVVRDVLCNITPDLLR